MYIFLYLYNLRGDEHVCVWNEHVCVCNENVCVCMRITWLIHMCDMTYSHVRHDSFTCVTWLIHMCDMTYSHVWHDSFTCVTWRIHMCDMTHSHVWHDLFTCVTWLIHMCDMTLSHVRHDSFTCVTWLFHMCDMTHSHVRHDLFTCATWLIHMCDTYISARKWTWVCMYVNENICIHEVMLWAQIFMHMHTYIYPWSKEHGYICICIQIHAGMSTDMYVNAYMYVSIQ